MTEQVMEKREKPAKNGKLGRRKILPLLAIVAGFVVFFAFGGHNYLSFSALSEHRETLQTWYAENTFVVTVGFCVLYALAVAFSLPGAVWMTLLGGFMFGTVLGAVLIISSATLGAVLIFLAARYALADFFRARAGATIQKMEAGFRQNAMSYLLVLRLVPIFPFWLVNLVPAFLGVRLSTYTIATFLGIIPGSVVYCSVGSGLGDLFEQGREPDLSIIFQPNILLPILGLAGLSMLPVVYKKIKSKTSDA